MKNQARAITDTGLVQKLLARAPELDGIRVADWLDEQGDESEEAIRGRLAHVLGLVLELFWARNTVLTATVIAETLRLLAGVWELRAASNRRAPIENRPQLRPVG